MWMARILIQKSLWRNITTQPTGPAKKYGGRGIKQLPSGEPQYANSSRENFFWTLIDTLYRRRYTSETDRWVKNASCQRKLNVLCSCRPSKRTEFVCASSFDQAQHSFRSSLQQCTTEISVRSRYSRTKRRPYTDTPCKFIFVSSKKTVATRHHAQTL